MKIRPTRLSVVLVTTLGLLSLFTSTAADVSTTATVTPAPVETATTTPAKLPYGVEDVLKLSQAQVGEDIIVNYVKSSGTIYSLSPADIVYLKNSGVSDRVINAMIDQRKLAVQAVPVQTQPTAPVISGAPSGEAVTAPPADHAVEAPLTPPASTVTVIPYPAATAAYYGYYYPYPYYGYYPGVSFAFRFGPGYHGYYRYGHYGHYGHGSYAVHGRHGGGWHGGGGHHR
jgi:hypothetical protein